jgi:MerR family redox-sensitive transcriptional activator SoxR
MTRHTKTPATTTPPPSERAPAVADEQIAALERLRDGLTTCIGCGCLSLQRCRLSNPDDVIGETGSGARYLPPALRASGQP